MLITLSTRQLEKLVSQAVFSGTASAFPPGVNSDNVLVDPKAYYYWLIGRADGQMADDWISVLTESGIPAGFSPYQVPYDNGFYGLTQQIGSGGVRGRLFLPTAYPDDLGYYSHPVDLLAGEEPNLEWFYKDRGEGPPYSPINSGTIPIPGPNPPPNQGGLTEERVIELIMENAIAYGSKIGLRVDNGQIIGIVGGGTPDGQPIELISRNEVHAWESLTVEKGE